MYFTYCQVCNKGSEKMSWLLGLVVTKLVRNDIRGWNKNVCSCYFPFPYMGYFTHPKIQSAWA